MAKSLACSNRGEVIGFASFLFREESSLESTAQNLFDGFKRLWPYSGPVHASRVSMAAHRADVSVPPVQPLPWPWPDSSHFTVSATTRWLGGAPLQQAGLTLPGTGKYWNPRPHRRPASLLMANPPSSARARTRTRGGSKPHRSMAGGT